jgi:hypothetical protein
MPSKSLRHKRTVRNARNAYRTVEVLKHLRAAGDTYEAIAKEFEIAERTVYRWASGESSPIGGFTRKLEARLALFTDAAAAKVA